MIFCDSQLSRVASLKGQRSVTMNLHTLLFYTCLTKEVLIALDTPSGGLFSAFLSRANGRCFVSLPFSHRLTPPSLQVANQCEEGFTIDQVPDR